MGAIKTIGQKRADELAGQAADIEAAAGELNELVAVLQDEDTKGDERRERSEELEERYRELRSDLREFGSRLGLAEGE